MYNFSIQILGHFSWKNWRKFHLNGATRFLYSVGSRPCTTSCAWPCQATPAADRARPPEHRCDRWSQGLCTDAHTQSSIATRSTSTGWANRHCRHPANGRAAVLGPRRCTSPPLAHAVPMM
jgi:hypothetical protein